MGWSVNKLKQVVVVDEVTESVGSIGMTRERRPIDIGKIEICNDYTIMVR